MKKSIGFLPKRHQSNLYYLAKKILKSIPQTQMIILYGSYARNKYVEYDERVEFGVPTYYMSDYDILVVTQGIAYPEVITRLHTIADNYHKGSDFEIPVQFINDSIENLNKELSDGRYFYAEVKQSGAMIYDSGNYKLARRRKLRFDEIKQQAEEYFEDKFKRATGFLKNAKFNYDEFDYQLSSFMLHQVFENLFHTTRLVFTLKSNKQHNIEKLLGSVRKYSVGFYEIFPLHIAEEKRLFELVAAAYVEGRYNPNFIVTKEDLDALMTKAQQAIDLVKQICEEQIAKYKKLAKEGEKEAK